MKILVNNSTKGINPISYYVETTAYIQTAAYSMHLGLQFSVYGENLFMVAQNIAIIFLMWHFDHHIRATEKLVFSAFFVTYATLLYGGFMPEEGWAYVSSSTIVLGLVSRMPQIL